MKDKPVRLYKQEDELEKLKKVLDSELVFKIKFYLLVIIAMIILFIVCSIIQPQTYGYINW